MIYQISTFPQCLHCSRNITCMYVRATSIAKTNKTSQISLTYAQSVSKPQKSATSLQSSSADAVKNPENTVSRRCRGIYIVPCRSAGLKVKYKNSSQCFLPLLHHGGYRFERIRKEKEKNRSCQAHAFVQMLHTSSVNLLFLPESREAGVSLLAKVAV